MLIQTISSMKTPLPHFNPLLDAVRIYALLGKFAFASISSSVLDLVIFALMTKLILPATFSESIAVATVVARVFSSLFNFTVNRHVVFQAGGKGHHRAVLCAGPSFRWPVRCCSCAR